MTADATSACRAAFAACQRDPGRRGQAHPTVTWSQRHQVCQVVLTGRATSLPFTAVMTGPQRTITDNVMAASTCTPHRLRRSRCRPIRLWEQGSPVQIRPSRPPARTPAQHGCRCPLTRRTGARCPSRFWWTAVCYELAPAADPDGRFAAETTLHVRVDQPRRPAPGARGPLRRSAPPRSHRV
jgi:hypothetical protein